MNDIPKTPVVKLLVNGRAYAGWQGVSIEKTIDAIAGRFTLTVTDKWRGQVERWSIFPGDECVLKLDDVTVLTGYVDATNMEYDAASRTISVTGRDKTGDLVDCSAVIKNQELRGLDLLEITKRIAEPFGIPVATEIPTGDKFIVFAIQPGETAWEAIERAARMRGAVMVADGMGGLTIADVGNQYSFDALIEGKNILSAQSSYDNKDRYSEYIVRGQHDAASDGWEDEPPKTTIVSRAMDENIKRYRPKIIIGEMQTDDTSAGSRAQLEAATRAGKSQKIRVRVRGWTQSDGTLWKVNRLTRIDSPMLCVSDTFVTSAVQFQVDNNVGIVSDIELTRPDAYLAGQGKIKRGKNKKKKGVGLGDAWESLDD